MLFFLLVQSTALATLFLSPTKFKLNFSNSISTPWKYDFNDHCGGSVSYIESLPGLCTVYVVEQMFYKAGSLAVREADQQ